MDWLSLVELESVIVSTAPYFEHTAPPKPKHHWLLWDSFFVDLGKDDPGSTFSAILLGSECKYNGQCGYGGQCAKEEVRSCLGKKKRETKIPVKKGCCCKKDNYNNFDNLDNPGTCFIPCSIWGGKWLMISWNKSNHLFAKHTILCSYKSIIGETVDKKS